MREPRVIALAGNPNVGKSTLFNGLTGMRQHTGNWPGKTVSAARGLCRAGGEEVVLVDIPGAYSLWAQSAEEEAALETVCFGGADAVLVVCAAASLERNLNLVYQIMEVTDRVAVCVNLMDEAERQGIHIDLDALARHLSVPVTGACARDGKGLKQALAAAIGTIDQPPHPRRALYPEPIERAAARLAAMLPEEVGNWVSLRFAALRLLEGDGLFLRLLRQRMTIDEFVMQAVDKARAGLSLSRQGLSAMLVEGIYQAAEKACQKAVKTPDRPWDKTLRADRLLTGVRGVPVMLLLLALVFYLTIQGANVPSQWLNEGFEALGEAAEGLLIRLGTSSFLRGLIVEGMLSTLGKVISVMLPPMAIFFPLFTLLEDSGYLPRIAFTLDGLFERCRACGKQALTMCMGLGCNAVGVTGCRIIDSPRERLIAILTNSLMPCNGRFPLLITVAAVFFGVGGAAVSALLLAGLIGLSAGMTLLLSRLLSLTVLRGLPSAYTLELPPYRAPRMGQVIGRSVLDRTLFVLGRAAAVAAPAGLVIYLLSRLTVAGNTLLSYLTGFLDPLGRFMGLDGVILTGFLLGFPANEIVLPLILLAYGAESGWNVPGDLSALGDILRTHGWTGLTALNVMLFSLFHFPCSTTLLTVYKETKSGKWTLLALLLPLALGVMLCALTHGIAIFF
ncbi:MAG: ferrous iron transport protein B [Clostridia bacterium]|nr:ferrous iron transport protein B [Clostridia bacterium]